MSPTKLVANIARRAMHLHEASYDTAVEDYARTIQEACDEAALEHGEPMLGRLVYLALERWWNDVVDWSDAVLREPSPSLNTDAD